MWLATDDFGEMAVACRKRSAGPEGTGRGEVGREDTGSETWVHIGALARAVVERIQDRAARNAPRVDPDEAPAGRSVAARAGRRRQIE